MLYAGENARHPVTDRPLKPLLTVEYQHVGMIEKSYSSALSPHTVCYAGFQAFSWSGRARPQHPTRTPANTLLLVVTRGGLSHPRLPGVCCECRVGIISAVVGCSGVGGRSSWF